MSGGVDWDLKPTELGSVRWTCGYCGTFTSANVGFRGRSEQFGTPLINEHVIVFCAGCGNPSHLRNAGSSSRKSQVPEPIYGESVSGVRDKVVEDLHLETRRCISVGAFTAAVLSCRKLLMHVAVDLGAQEDQSFAYYTSFLKTDNHVTPASHSWLDAIRESGNQQNHEIHLATGSQARDLVDFCTMLLQTVYEYPARAEEHKKSNEEK